MKYTSTLIAVSDMPKSLDFYKNVLGLEVTADFGASVTLSDRIVLQTLDTWENFIQNNMVIFGSNSSELYFEENDMDAFIERLKTYDIEYVHPLKEHSWGQRVIRFFDPDRHIIEVGENITMVVRRFIDSGLSEEETALRMDVPLDLVKSCNAR